MRKTLTTLLASTAMVAFASQAMAECSFGHIKQVMASTVDDEGATMSTFDGDAKLPGEVTEAEEASVVPLPSDDEQKIAE